MPRTASAPAKHPATLRRYYRRLYRHFGPQHWWPASLSRAGSRDSRFEVVVGALLTQNTAWTNVEKALANLSRYQRDLHRSPNGRRPASLSPAKLAQLSPAQLARCLRPAGYFRQKTRYLRRFLEHLRRHYGGALEKLLRRPTAALRAELLGLTGIGPETADSILLYAAGRPVFVVDAYTRRVLARHGLAHPEASYDELQAFFHRNLSKIPSAAEGPRDSALYNEYHALLVAVGKHFCHARQPNCAACPLGPELEAPHGR